MNITRYVVTQAVKTKDNELIPIWDERLIFEKTEMYGNGIKLKNNYHTEYFNLVECIFDLKTKKIEVGIELDYYPFEKDLEFKIGEVVFFEKSHRNIQEAIIKEIIYEEYELEIKRGNKIEKYLLECFKHLQIESNTLYAIKSWKPFYILNDGTKIEWSYNLYHKNV